MNDPKPTEQTVVNDPPPNDPPPRARPHPLLWLLLVLVLIALAWFFFSQRSSVTPASDVNTPTMIGDGNTPAADNRPTGNTASQSSDRKKSSSIRKPATPSKQAATLLQQPQPEYPRDAERAGVEGTVMILASVDAGGDVTDVKIDKRSGSVILDRAAMKEVRNWHFQPATQDGKAVASVVQVPVQYKMEKQ